jgi:molybdopterin synthase catalytic subunit
MKITILDKQFDPWQSISDYQKTLTEHTAKYGATAVFVGTMRDLNEDKNISDMFLEHYPGMTEKYLEKISQESIDKHQLMDSLIIHRVGHIKPDETIVLVAVWSGHRKQAFEACREIMEELKSKAPFWKKETLKSGQAHWVEHNTKGY